MQVIRALGRFIHKLSRYLYWPLGWTLLTIGLLCLPGNALPGSGIFGIKHIDKIAHFILFGGIVLFWAIWTATRLAGADTWQKKLIPILLFSIGLGVAMEFIQVNYIPNRSFDDWDIVWDAIGSLTAAVVLIYRGKSWQLL